MIQRVVIALAATAALAGIAQAKDRKPADPNKQVCHADVPTGSRFPVRTCHTAAEWSAINDGNERAARVTLDRATQAGLAGGVSTSAN